MGVRPFLICLWVEGKGESEGGFGRHHGGKQELMSASGDAVTQMTDESEQDESPMTSNGSSGTGS